MENFNLSLSDQCSENQFHCTAMIFEVERKFKEKILLSVYGKNRYKPSELSVSFYSVVLKHLWVYLKLNWTKKTKQNKTNRYHEAINVRLWTFEVKCRLLSAQAKELLFSEHSDFFSVSLRAWADDRENC